MKILWTKAGGIVPLDIGGRIRSFQTLKELAKNHEITVYTFYEELKQDPHRDIEKFFHRVLTTPVRVPARRSLQDLLLFARTQATGQAYTMSKWYLPEFVVQCASSLNRKSMIWSSVTSSFPPAYFPGQLHAQKYCSRTISEAEVWERQMQLTGDLRRKLAYWLEYKALSRAETATSRLQTISLLSPIETPM